MPTKTKHHTGPSGLGWKRIRFWRLTQITGTGPVQRRWQWREEVIGKRVVWLLDSPDGETWEFKLQRGAWIRPYEPSNKNS
jgi:hypothetical protein